jgi:RNA polymerase sigma-70 factor (ECF subfamily)
MIPGFLGDVNIRAALSLADKRPSAVVAHEQEVVLLFDDLRVPMLRYLMSFGLAIPDCEEIVQESFLALFLHLQRGRCRRSLRSWLFRVAHNMALKRLNGLRREARRLSDCEGETCDLAVDPLPNPEDQVSHNQMQTRLMAVFHALPEQSRQCLSLRAEGLRYREIAEVLDISLGAVALLLARSLARTAEAAKR